MNRQNVDKPESENLNQLVMNEIINNLWARGGAISHDENNDIIKVIVDSEVEKNGEKQIIQDMFTYSINPKSSITLSIMAGNTLGLDRNARPKNLNQAYMLLQDANAKLISELSEEEQQALYEKDFINVPGHEWITKNDIFSKESEKVNLTREFAQA